jgi:hypothetical protein
MMEELIPIVAIVMVFGLPLFIVWVVFYFNTRNRANILETVRTAAQNGTELTPELVAALGLPKAGRGHDIRWGIVLLAVAAAFLVLGVTLSIFEDALFNIMTGVAAFPGFVGIALIAMGVLMRDKSNDA